jgi:perosamine synthetase
MNKYIPVNRPLLDGNEKKYVCDAIDSGWISSDGPFVELFEQKFAKSVGRKYGIAVSNGTAALEVSIRALGIKKGDEVIIPSFTIISCAIAVVNCGATPIFIDCYRDTWNINVDQIEERITKKTKAIMAVHIYGLPAEMNKIIAIAKRHGLLIIEDAAEAHGQKYYGKSCGSFGKVSTFSFYANKHLTTGEGGMILTDNFEIAQKCKKLRNLCFEPSKRYYHRKLGWNYRLTNLQAAVGLAQLETLSEHIEKKIKIGATYQSKLNNCSNV